MKKILIHSRHLKHPVKLLIIYNLLSLSQTTEHFLAPIHVWVPWTIGIVLISVVKRREMNAKLRHQKGEKLHLGTKLGNNLHI